jgi:hypothetical protein
MPFRSREEIMSHRAGIHSGIDYGAVAVFLLWIVMTIVLVIVFAIKGHADDKNYVTSPLAVSDLGTSRAGIAVPISPWSDQGESYGDRKV